MFDDSPFLEFVGPTILNKTVLDIITFPISNLFINDAYLQAWNSVQWWGKAIEILMIPQRMSLIRLSFTGSLAQASTDCFQLISSTLQIEMLSYLKATLKFIDMLQLSYQIIYATIRRCVTTELSNSLRYIRKCVTTEISN